ncbi:Crp/Fnr family transcriptional regulator [Peribacillus sp. SCS-155]|uniref:Crp/Fnr family transcriptional regulator n=1 Tax=Peribacillus sedimenti TaxID=3115297 RepID=UPI003906619B
MHQYAIPLQLQEMIYDHYPVRKIMKGCYVFQESTPAKELFFILEGKVQLSKIIPDGRELALRVCSRNEIVGEMVLFSSSPKYMMNAKMIEAGKVAVIPKVDLEEKITLNGELAIGVMKWLADQYRITQTKFRDLILHGKKGALYSTLIRLTNSYGVKHEAGITISLPLTNQDLANFCGTSREGINRMLSELRNYRIISSEKGIITIHDLEHLKREIHCEDCPIEVCNIE